MGQKQSESNGLVRRQKLFVYVLIDAFQWDQLFITVILVLSSYVNINIAVFPETMHRREKSH